MVWNDAEIDTWAKRGGVEPYDLLSLNPTSLDLKMGNLIREPDPLWYTLSEVDMRIHIANGTIDDLPRWGEAVEFETFWMMPRRFVLCHSLEFIRIPDNMVSLLFSKSSVGRIGLEHLHAGLGDPGWGNDPSLPGCQWTWELHNVAPWPIKLEAGKRVMQQIMLQMTDSPLRTYRETGRYNNQSGPMPAKLER